MFNIFISGAAFAFLIMDGLMVSPDKQMEKVIRKMSSDQINKMMGINKSATGRNPCGVRCSHWRRGNLCINWL